MRRIIAAVFAVAGVSRASHAQTTPASQTFTRKIDSAMRLANDGQMAVARAAIDSLLRVTSMDSPQAADALFARATLAESVLDANLDYEKIVREFPGSERRQQSLLRLAQRSIVEGDNAKALELLRILRRDYRADSSQAISSYWLSRVLLDEHDVTAACTASRDATARAASGNPALRVAIATQSEAACGSSLTSTMADSGGARSSHPAIQAIPPATTRPSGQSRAIYAVQVSAYANRADAEDLAERLKKSGLDAHVDGNAKPFRVRIGHYHTYAEAAAALQELKARKLAGFVAEMTP